MKLFLHMQLGHWFGGMTEAFCISGDWNKWVARLNKQTKKNQNQKHKQLAKGFQSRTQMQQQTFPKAEPEIKLLSTPVTEYKNEGSILETTAISVT